METFLVRATSPMSCEMMAVPKIVSPDCPVSQKVWSLLRRSRAPYPPFEFRRCPSNNRMDVDVTPIRDLAVLQTMRYYIALRIDCIHFVLTMQGV